jgi:hypothetical protein
MTETLSEFRQRVARLRLEHPLWRYNTAVWNAVCYRDYGATYAQKGWQRELVLAQKIAIYGDPYSDGFGADRFIADAIEAGVLLNDTAPERQAEVCLGVQTVPAAPAVPLRWVEQDDGGAKLTLGDVSIAEVYTPIDDADAVWYAESEHRIAPRHADFPDRATAMRAVEQAFGITAPLPVEGE